MQSDCRKFFSNGDFFGNNVVPPGTVRLMCNVNSSNSRFLNDLSR